MLKAVVDKHSRNSAGAKLTAKGDKFGLLKGAAYDSIDHLRDAAAGQLLRTPVILEIEKFHGIAFRHGDGIDPSYDFHDIGSATEPDEGNGLGFAALDRGSQFVAPETQTACRGKNFFTRLGSYPVFVTGTT